MALKPRLRALCFWVRALLIATCNCIACAASDRFNQETFAKLEPQASTQAEVYSALGTPQQVMNNQWYYVRPDNGQSCIIEFDSSGYVQRKQWMHTNKKGRQ